jgi:hypothetical protein
LQIYVFLLEEIMPEWQLFRAFFQGRGWLLFKLALSTGKLNP